MCGSPIRGRLSATEGLNWRKKRQTLTGSSAGGVPKSGRCLREQVRDQSSGEQAADAAEVHADPGQGDQEDQDPQRGEERCEDGPVQAGEEEAAIAMDFHHTIERDDRRETLRIEETGDSNEWRRLRIFWNRQTNPFFCICPY